MKLTVIAISALAVGCGSSSPESSTPQAAPEPVASPAPVQESIDAPEAPNFSLPDLEGKTTELSSFAGKTVVLEWFNPGCPFVKYAHGEGPLKDLASTHTANGVVWLAINSSAPGNQGHGVGLNQSARQGWNMTHPVLIDESGSVGKLYGATSTPAMFVINKEGRLIYKGALDNAPLGKADGDVINYVEKAISASDAGQLPEIRETQSYGCSVKYAQN